MRKPGSTNVALLTGLRHISVIVTRQTVPKYLATFIAHKKAAPRGGSQLRGDA